MVRLPWPLLGAALALTACPRTEPASTATALPTRPETIDPVNRKLDAAAQGVARRRQDIDNAAK